MSFNLRHLVREVHDGTDLTDYQEMAEAVIAQIPARDRKTALLVAMTEYCRWTSASLRSSAPVVAPSASPPPSTRSWKRDGLRDWQRRLHERYTTADGVKLLADCTVDDLVFMAEELERQAAAKQAKAQGWRGLAEALTAADAGRVGDLPAEALAANLSDVAA